MSTPTPSPTPRPASAGMSRINPPRLSGWLLITLALLLAVWVVAPQQLPVSLYKFSLVTLAAVVGYWIDRSLFPYARPHDVLKQCDALADALAAQELPVSCDDAMCDCCALMPPSESLLTLVGTSMLRRAIIVGCAMLAMGLGA